MDIDELYRELNNLIILETLIKTYKNTKRDVITNDRQFYNNLILKSLSAIIKENPDLRFMQILGNLGYDIKYNGKDAYYEESFDTIKNINK